MSSKPSKRNVDKVVVPMPFVKSGLPIVFVDEIMPRPTLPADTTLDARIAYVIEQLRGEPLTDFTIVKVEQAVSSVFVEAEFRGEIRKAPRPLAIKIPISGRVEIVDWPENVEEAWATWDRLRTRLSPAEANAARDDLLRRLPQFYDRPRPRELPPEPITHEMFVAATGRQPIHDDLERANCPQAGELGHYGCGWNIRQNKPQWECG